jgi:hypothetical protein
MSETDSFIEEVTEEVRRDRLFAMFRKYGWIAVLAVLIIVGTASFIEWRKAQARYAAESLGDAILNAVAMPDEKARIGALAELSPGTPGGTAVVGMISAAALEQQGDIKAADAKLAAVEADTKVPGVYRDLASMKRLLLKGGGLTGAERTATIDRLARPGGPFRTLALEQRGLGLVASGDKAGALKIFSELTQDAVSTQALVQRSRQMILVLGGTPKKA